jgi:hypothetical protein
MKIKDIYPSCFYFNLQLVRVQENNNNIRVEEKKNIYPSCSFFFSAVNPTIHRHHRKHVSMLSTPTSILVNRNPLSFFLFIEKILYSFICLKNIIFFWVRPSYRCCYLCFVTNTATGEERIFNMMRVCVQPKKNYNEQCRTIFCRLLWSHAVLFC